MSASEESLRNRDRRRGWQRTDRCDRAVNWEVVIIGVQTVSVCVGVRKQSGLRVVKKSSRELHRYEDPGKEGRRKRKD